MRKENIQLEIFEAIEKLIDSSLSKTNYLFLGEGEIIGVDNFSNSYSFIYQGEEYAGVSLTGERYEEGDVVYILFSNDKDIKKMIVSKTKRYSSVNPLTSTGSGGGGDVDLGPVYEAIERLEEQTGKSLETLKELIGNLEVENDTIKTGLESANKNIELNEQNIGSLNNKIDNMTIGAINLIPKSNKFCGLIESVNGASLLCNENIEVAEWQAMDATQIITASGQELLKAKRGFDFKTNKKLTYTFTVWVKNNEDFPVRVITSIGGSLVKAKESKRVVITGNGSDEKFYFGFAAEDLSNDNLDLIVWRTKLEVGNIPSDWSPAIQDFDDELKVINQTITEHETSISLNSEAIITEARSREENIKEVYRDVDDKFNDLELSSTNLLPDSERELISQSEDGIIIIPFNFKNNNTYSVSYYFKIENLDIDIENLSIQTTFVGEKDLVVTDEVKDRTGRIIHQLMTQKNNFTEIHIKLIDRTNSQEIPFNTLIVHKVQIELGSEATEWSLTLSELSALTQNADKNAEDALNNTVKLEHSVTESIATIKQESKELSLKVEETTYVPSLATNLNGELGHLNNWEPSTGVSYNPLRGVVPNSIDLLPGNPMSPPKPLFPMPDYLNPDDRWHPTAEAFQTVTVEIVPTKGKLSETGLKFSSVGGITSPKIWIKPSFTYAYQGYLEGNGDVKAYLIEYGIDGKTVIQEQLLGASNKEGLFGGVVEVSNKTYEGRIRLVNSSGINTISEQTIVRGPVPCKYEQNAHTVRENLRAELKIESGKIEQSVTNLKEQTDAKFTVQSQEISSKVSKGNISSEINQTPQAVKIRADKIALEGLVTINGGFKVDTSGNITAKNATFENATITGNLNAGTIGKLKVDANGIMFPNGKLRLNSATNSIDFGKIKMTYASYSTPNSGNSFDVIDVIGNEINSMLRMKRGSIQLGDLPSGAQNGYDVFFGQTLGNYGTFSVSGRANGKNAYASIDINYNELAKGPVSLLTVDKLRLGGRTVTIDSNGWLKAL